MKGNWKQRAKQRAKTRALALTRGGPVPGTGVFHGHSSRGKRLRPYERLRPGGGHKDHHGSGWNARPESGPDITED